jgi:hypothetical protein
MALAAWLTSIIMARWKWATAPATASTRSSWVSEPPLAPIEHRRCRAVSLGHLAGVGLDLVLTVLAPNDQADLSLDPGTVDAT